jgi:hypothetical protein
MMLLFLLVVLLATGAAVWVQGLWNGVVTLVNLILAAAIASSFFEPIAKALEGVSGDVKSYTYLLDFILIWILFAIAFGILRAITDALSSKAVDFPLPVEIAGRSILAIACGWVMVCFVAFTLQMAPLNSPNPLGAWATPTSKAFGPLAPDRLWLGFLYSRSRPAAFGGQQFDKDANFLIKYHDRRVKYAAPGTTMRFQ